MARPKTLREPDAEDIRLIMECKIERERLRHELTRLGPAKRRAKGYRDRVAKIHKDLEQLSNEVLAEKFELTPWIVSRL